MVKIVDCKDSKRMKRKRVSKKNKIAWRKYSKTKDVEEFLDDQRYEERAGVKFSTVDDDKIFFVDKNSGPSRKKKEAIRIQTNAERKLAAKQVLEGVPKCFQALLPHTSVPDPVIKRSRVRTKEERKHPIRKKIEENRRACGILTAKEKLALKNRELSEIMKQNKPIKGEFLKDIWEEEPEELPCDKQWLDETTFRHVLKNTGKIQKAVPASIRSKPSILPAIETPHPGLSYNPSYTDHQALLQEIVERENMLIKEEAHIKRVTSDMFSKVTRSEADDLWIKEMLQGHQKSDENIVEVKEENEISEYKPVNPPSKDKKKTKKQRRNLKLAKEAEHKKQLKAIEKKKVADIYKLKKIVQSMEKTELKLLKNQLLRKEKKKLQELDAKHLSKVKFEDLEKEFNMPCDLSGNLRAIKIEGNLFKDRFKRLQKRNIIEPTAIHRQKAAKRKAFVKSSHKESQEIPVSKYRKSK